MTFIIYIPKFKLPKINWKRWRGVCCNYPNLFPLRNSQYCCNHCKKTSSPWLLFSNEITNKKTWTYDEMGYIIQIPNETEE